MRAPTTGRPLLVALSGSARDGHAIRWAAQEALRRGASLRMVYIASRFERSRAGGDGGHLDVAPDNHDHGGPPLEIPSGVAAAARTAAAPYAQSLDIRLDVIAGRARPTLESLSSQAEMLAVPAGRGRTLGPTSLPTRIARRGTGSVVVVPKPAAEPQRRGSVAVLLPDEPAPGILDFALEHAAHAGANVIFIVRRTSSASGLLRGFAEQPRLIDHWSTRYPDVVVSTRVVARPSHDDVRSAVHGASLVVADPGRGRAWARAMRAAEARDLRALPSWPIALVPAQSVGRRPARA